MEFVKNTSLLWQAQRSHAQFHRELVEGAVERLTVEETRVLVRGLSGIAAFIREHHPAS